MHPSDYEQRNHKLAKTIIDYFGYRYFLNKRVLDLGCFNGEMANALARVGARVVAVDARKEHLVAINKKYPHITTIQLDLDDPTDKGWGFGDFQFDVVLSLGVMSHLKDFSLHLERICSAADIVVLETEVLDLVDKTGNMMFNEDKVVVDASFNGVVNVVSTINIQNTLSELGATFKRIDETKLNTKHHKYDWNEKNTGRNNSCRRMWFIRRDRNIARKVLHGRRAAMIKKEMEDQATLVRQRAGEEIARVVELVLRPALDMIPVHTLNTSLSQDLSINNYISEKIISTKSSENRLRVLYLPLGNQKGMVDAWNNIGVNLVSFDFWSLWEQTKNRNLIREEFLTRVKNFKPELIHMQLQFTGLLDNTALAEARQLSPGVIITNWSGDVRANAVPQFTSLAPALDHSFISSTGQLNMYKNAGCNNVKYWQIGYDPKFSFPVYKNNFEYDVSFIGNNYGNNFPDGKLRLDAVNKCRTEFKRKFGLFGTGYGKDVNGIDPTIANSIYNNSVCVLSISHFNNISHYFSDRLLYCLASGRPTITWYFPGVEEYFVEGEEILIARSMQDMIDKIYFCKNNIEAANKIGKNGYEKAIKYHTYTSRVSELIKILNLTEKL